MTDNSTALLPAKPRRTGKSRRVLAAGVTAVIASSLLAYGSPVAADATTAQALAACVNPPNGPEPATGSPTTITTLEQAYHCVLAHAYNGPIMDNRALLKSAFSAFTQELQRRDLDRPTAVLHKLTGDREADWDTFAKTYETVLADLPDQAELRQALASATMRGIITSLHDNHNTWLPSQTPSTTQQLGFGVALASEGRAPIDMRDATGPIYLKAVAAGSPAAKAGLRPGDVIEKINGLPLFVNGMLSPGLLEDFRAKSAQDSVRLAIRRPATGKTITVKLRPAAMPRPEAPAVTAERLSGDIAHVVMPMFAPEAANTVLKKIAELREDKELRGVILDLRGNGGGRDEEVSKLLSALVHDKVYSWECDVKGDCEEHRTDTTTPLLKLPIAVLTDSACASACDAFSSAVKSLGLGKLVGARTAGGVAGLPQAYQLEDKSVLLLTPRHHASANGEIVDGMGVPVDYQAPMTAKDYSAGTDPGVAKALKVLGS